MTQSVDPIPWPGSQGDGTGTNIANGPPGPFETMLQQVLNIQSDRRNTPIKLPFQLANFVNHHETHAGSQFICADGKPWLFDAFARKIYEISLKDDGFAHFLTNKYGLLRVDRIAQQVTHALAAQTMHAGDARELRRYSYYSSAEKALYLSRYNGTAYRLDGNEIQVVPNGTGVLFIDDDGGIPVEADIGNHGILFDRLVNDIQFVKETDSGTTPATQRHLFTLWLFATGIPDLFPTKPLLLVTGDKGAGKTTALQRAQLVIHGRDVVQSVGQRGEDDFGVTILRKPIAILDNVDKPIDWLPDALCAYATGGSWTRRALYTNTGQVEIKPYAFIALATKNPATFKRDDVADRCIVLRLDRRAAHDGYLSLHRIRESLIADRPKLYGEWLFYMNRIISEYKKDRPAKTTTHRLADFAENAELIGRAIGLDDTVVDGLLNAAQYERESIVIEGDPFVDVTDKWLDITTNVGREIAGEDKLFEELHTVAVFRRLPFYKSIRTMTARLRESDAALARHFVMTKRVREGVTYYSFRRRVA